MLYERPIQLFLLLVFLVLYIMFAVFWYSRLKKRQIQQAGDKELTLSLIKKAQSQSKKLYSISSQFGELKNKDIYGSKYEPHLERTTSKELKELTLLRENTADIIELLNLYNSISAGVVNHILNEKLVLFSLDDDFNIAYKAFSPYFSYFRSLFSDEQLFINFEFLVSNNRSH